MSKEHDIWDELGKVFSLSRIAHASLIIKNDVLSKTIEQFIESFIVFKIILPFVELFILFIELQNCF